MAGRILSFTENSSTSTMAIQKDGAETPNRDTKVPMRSKAEYCLTAATIPAATPITIPKSVLSTASFSVLG